ncbi:MAG TPA: hypothetical protein VFY16_03540, partial [Gemmatimonadaceae bacterium]|nr:hypothetical protein [Gemmatimonadaceae bacterium]
LLGVTTLGAPLGAQSAASLATPESTPVPAPVATRAIQAGPVRASVAVGVRAVPRAERPAAPAMAQRRGGLQNSQILMIVGGAALLTGLIIGDDAGTVLAIGGTVVGLVGLYQYLQANN